MVAARFLGFLAAFLLLGSGGSAAAPARCSTDCLVRTGPAFLEKKDGVWFFVGGRAVDVTLFCKAMGFCAEKGRGCDGLSDGGEWSRIREEYCSGSLAGSPPVDGELGAATSAVNINRISGRKILQHFSANSSFSSLPNGDTQKEGRQTNNAYLTLSSEKMAIIAPSTFLLCCVFFCPCFHAKTKDKPHESSSPRELDKVDSVPSSLDASLGPQRAQQNPLRVPASPHRIPQSPSPYSSSQLSRVGSVQLSLSQIARATQNFSPSNLIGGGVFGTVYKAHLPDGQVVAVKKARKEQAANLKSEFSNEVELLSKIEHRNLVRLLGYTEKGNERIIITEYVPNGNLREHLDGHHGNILDFNRRLEIAIDVAHALTYLHAYADKQIIHRDIKASNILLTEGFRGKVADFGFARTGPTSEDQTHISTNIKGTAGYVDPEYLRTCQLTPKSDVFSFGILLIEILSGRRPVETQRVKNERITIKWAFKKFEEGNMVDLLDPFLEEVVNKEILSKLYDLAFQCAVSTRSERPVMKEVVEKLWEIRKEYSRNRRSKLSASRSLALVIFVNDKDTTYRLAAAASIAANFGIL